MIIEDNNLNDFMDFLLGDPKEEKSKEKDEKYYKCCNRFYGKEKLVCENILKLGSWLSSYDGLNMKSIIDTILKEKLVYEDFNSEYQLPLSYLYQTKKIDDIIKKTDGSYYTKKLSNCCLIKNDKGDWDYVNKLNTNNNDISELLTTLFIKGGKIDHLTTLNVTETKKYLLDLKSGDILLKLFKKYFTIDEYYLFTHNTKSNTILGDYVEELTKELLEKEGYTTLYVGGNGDLIDMCYGIDIIMEKEGKIYLIQSKMSSENAKKSIENKNYRYIDIFSGEPTNKNGLVLYSRENDFKEKFVGKDILEKNLNYMMNKYK